MTQGKKAVLWVLIGAALVLGTGAYTLFQIRIPITGFALDYLEKKSSGFGQSFALRVDKISVDLKGKIFVRGLRLGSPVALDVNSMEVSFSLLDWLSGKFLLDELNADSVTLFRKSVESAQEEWLRYLSDKHIAPLDYLKHPRLHTRNLLVLDNADHMELRIKRARVEIEPGQRLKAKIESRTARIRDFTPFENLSLIAESDPAGWRFKNIKCHWGGAEISGWAFHQTTGAISLFLDFKRMDLAEFTKDALNPGERITGSLAGHFQAAGKMGDLKSFNADGDLLIKNLRLKDMPLQKDIVIQSYMPDMRDLTMKTVRVPAFRYRGDVMYIDSLFGKGVPLSIAGKGRLKFPVKMIGKDFEIQKFLQAGHLSLFLTCNLEETYFQSLKSVVKDGLYRNKKNNPTFKCEIKGDLKSQSIFLEKVVSRVLKSFSKKMTKTIKQLFR